MPRCGAHTYGEGNINVELTFENMDDFSPAAVVRKVDALNKLLEAREQLESAYFMDGKTGAEESWPAAADPALCRRWRRRRIPRRLVMTRVNCRAENIHG